MPGYLKQSTAAQSRALGPFVSDTDFKTVQTGLTIANTDIKLVVNGGASANKNSGGGTHRVNGVYGITFDATDTATVGEMEVSVVVAGALPVFDKFFVVEEAVYDMLFAASALGYINNAPVNVAQFGGSNGTFASGRPEVNTSHIAGSAVSTSSAQIGVNVVNAAGTAWGSGAITAGSVAASALNGKGDWNIGKTGYSLSAAGIQAIWDALTSALTTVGSIGKLLVDNINATISSRLASASYTAPLDAAGTRTAVGLASANLDTQLSTIDTVVDSILVDTAEIGAAGAGLTALATQASVNTVDTVVDAIKAKTDSLAFTVAGQVDANIQYVNDVLVNGDGQPGSEWGP